MARRGFVLGIVIWCVLALLLDSQGQEAQQLAVAPMEKENPELVPAEH